MGLHISIAYASKARPRFEGRERTTTQTFAPCLKGTNRANGNCNSTFSFALSNETAEKDYDVIVITITSNCIATHRIKYSSFRYGYSISIPAGTKLF